MSVGACRGGAVVVGGASRHWCCGCGLAKVLATKCCRPACGSGGLFSVAVVCWKVESPECGARCGMRRGFAMGGVPRHCACGLLPFLVCGRSRCRGRLRLARRVLCSGQRRVRAGVSCYRVVLRCARWLRVAVGCVGRPEHSVRVAVFWVFAVLLCWVARPRILLESSDHGRDALSAFPSLALQPVGPMEEPSDCIMISRTVVRVSWFSPCGSR